MSKEPNNYDIAGHHYLFPGDTEESMRYVSKDVFYRSGKEGAVDYEAWHATHERLLSAFRVVEADILHQAENGNLVITHWAGKMEHIGPFLGIPATRRVLDLRGFGIDVVENGLVVEHWGLQDALGLLRQLEA